MTGSAPRDPPMPRWQRALLPAVLGAGPETEARARRDLPRSVRDWLVDVVLFVLALAIGATGLLSNLQQVGVALGLLDATLGTIACLLLWIRRRHPLAVGGAAVAASALSGMAGGAGLAGLFTVAIHCPPRRTAQLAALSVLASAISPALYRRQGSYDWSSLVFGLVGTAVVVGYGLFVRARRELVLSLHERSRRLEAEQHLRVQEARHAERTRIAREMHDVLAHRISLLSVHAGALEFNPAASPEEIARAAAVIRMSARAAQEELREVIGVLRDDAEGSSVQPPQPTLVDVPELVAESRRAGMDVAFELALDPAPLPERLGRTVYRLVQETLTNARKHAPGQRVTIEITGDHEAGVTVRVTNRPLVGHAIGRVGAGSASASEPAAGTGTGLIGLAERVVLAGGELSHAPLDDGGFAVRATLPWREGP
ncbi:MAG: sensor histidine kinase [Solirubrobacteraceae bacterium]